MKTLITILLILPLELLAQVKAFPTAEGWGRNATGGRGGIVLIVTNLNNSGAGSFRDAAESSGERIIVFEVCGTIDLQGDNIVIDDPNCTVAGQTAPGDGIVLTEGELQVSASNVVVRNIRSRPNHTGVLGSDQINAMQIARTGTVPDSVIFDHCSFSHASDINVSIFDTVTNVTIQNCILGPAIGPDSPGGSGHNANFGNLTTAPEDEDQKNVLTNFTFAKNLVIHTRARNPKFGYYAEMLNNVMYNTGTFAVELNAQAHVDIIGNVFIDGPETSGPPHPIEIIDTDTVGGPPYDTASSPLMRIYVKDNIHPDDPTASLDPTLAVDHNDFTDFCEPNCFEDAPMAASGQEPILSSLTLSYVLANAGALPLDDFDTQYILDVTQVNAGQVNAEEVLPTLTCGSSPTDTDDDGMPDYWEEQRGHDRNVISNSLDLNGNGYDDIEDYINGILDGEQFAPTTSGNRIIIKEN